MENGKDQFAKDAEQQNKIKIEVRAHNRTYPICVLN
tara:strand:- start:6 stop:113 length:108 start_codon:yes stop_codon:yes gene_type:complete